MNRVTEVKNGSGPVSRTVEPITVGRHSDTNSYSSLPKRNDDGYRKGFFSTDSYSPPLNERLNSDDRPRVEEIKWDSGLDSGGFEAGVTNTRLWHSFTTDFNSASFSNIKWNPNPRISGIGGDVNIYFAEDKAVVLSLGGGGFHNEITTNSQAQGSFFAREQTTTDAFWMDAGIRSKPSRWVYLQGLLGLFVYEIRTEIQTNAPAYSYEGLSGNRVFGAAGVGGGLETPWDFPVHLFTGVRIWLPLSDDAFYESAVGQLSGGLLFRF